MHIDNYYSIYIQIEIIYKYICNKHTFSFINIHNQAQCFHSSGLVIRKGHLGIGNKNEYQPSGIGNKKGGTSASDYRYQDNYWPRQDFL